MWLTNQHTDYQELAERIRTLTGLLHRFDVRKSPTRQPQDVLPFLHHFTTLLTCDDKHDDRAKKVIAVTGSINAANQVRTLVVSQNPYLRSNVQTISLQLVKKQKRPLGDVIKEPPNPPLVDHVADVWTTLFALDQSAEGPKYDRQLEDLQLFFLTRSYRKFVVRFREDDNLCRGKRLHEVISEWLPDCAEITPKWVSLPQWILQFRAVSSIKSRVVEGQVQWEFSDDTKQAWSKILEIMLLRVDNAIKQVTAARGKSGKKAEEEALHAMKILNRWSSVLCYFVIWEANIVKSLLTETNIVASIATRFMPVRGTDSIVDETADDAAPEFLQEPGESQGHQVYRYLKTVVAWHAAVFYLSKDPTLPKLLEGVEIGLVEVPPSPSSVLTPPQISEGLFARFPDMMDLREEIESILKDRHLDTFRGCVHAEATLMSLVNYYAHETTYANRSAVLMNTPEMRNIVLPVADARSAVIAVSKKCCWCCDWLGRHLETQFKLPGTHGIIFPWDPPTLGIGVSVLGQLEKALWDELREAVSNEVSLAYSRHSSAGSEPRRARPDQMPSVVLDI